MLCFDDDKKHRLIVLSLYTCIQALRCTLLLHKDYIIISAQQTSSSSVRKVVGSRPDFPKLRAKLMITNVCSSVLSETYLFRVVRLKIFRLSDLHRRTAVMHCCCSTCQLHNDQFAMCEQFDARDARLTWNTNVATWPACEDNAKLNRAAHCDLLSVSLSLRVRWI